MRGLKTERALDSFSLTENEFARFFDCWMFFCCFGLQAIIAAALVVRRRHLKNLLVGFRWGCLGDKYKVCQFVGVEFWASN